MGLEDFHETDETAPELGYSVHNSVIWKAKFWSKKQKLWQLRDRIKARMRAEIPCYEYQDKDEQDLEVHPTIRPAWLRAMRIIIEEVLKEC